jgi:hypothetical protein
MIPFLLAAIVPGLFWDQGPETAEALKKAGVTRVLVAPESVASWRALGSWKVEPFDVAGAVKIAAPGVQMRPNVAFATRSPWIDTNGATYMRQPEATFLVEANGAASGVAAAEAHLFGAAVAIQTDVAGIEPLSRMVAFLEKLKPAEMPPLANIGYIDDGSEESAELMRLLVRRNLLFRLVKQPERRLNLNIAFGSPQYPREEAADPSAMAQKVRSQLRDERRLLRVYGSEVVVGRLFGDGKRVRVHLLNYSAAGRPVNGIRVRVLGRYPRHELAVSGDTDAKLLDYMVTPEATEFTVELLHAYAVVDLMR